MGGIIHGKMQVLKNLFQVGGDINGLTFDLQGALWNDGNSYLLKICEHEVLGSRSR